jgi:hypothetical protein
LRLHGKYRKGQPHALSNNTKRMSLQPAKTDIFKVEKAQRSIGREKSQSKTRQAKGQAIRRTTVPNHWGFIRAFAQTTRAISKACARTTRSLSVSLSLTCLRLRTWPAPPSVESIWSQRQTGLGTAPIRHSREGARRRVRDEQTLAEAIWRHSWSAARRVRCAMGQLHLETSERTHQFGRGFPRMRGPLRSTVDMTPVTLPRSCSL